MDLALLVEAKQSIGLLVACRPWVFSMLAGGAPERSSSGFPKDRKDRFLKSAKEPRRPELFQGAKSIFKFPM